LIAFVPFLLQKDMTFGPDGALYVSNFGFGFFDVLPLNSGQIVRISIPISGIVASVTMKAQRVLLLKN